MQALKRLPYDEIRSKSIDEILIELQRLDGVPVEVQESVHRAAKEILTIKDYCNALGVRWEDLKNRERAYYGAMLLITEGYSF